MIDAFKAIASLVVVLHHLAAYGPIAGTAQQALPGIMGWLYDYGRIAVQVFLVIGGFLAARSLSSDGRALASPLPLIGKRYLRLTIPFLIAIGLAIAGSALANLWMDDDAIPGRATFSQWLAHALLLHGVLGFESLSAGVWYVAIDFQLFAMMALLLWFGRVRPLGPVLVLAVGTAALFWFNRIEALNNWGIYFFGSYGLGAAAWWASDRRRLAAWLGVITSITIAALLIDFRLRIAVALCVALTLGFSRRYGWLERFPNHPLPAFLGKISYSVFLVHFPICLIVNALFVRFEASSSAAAIFGMISTLTASIGLATVFHRWVESPAASQRIINALLNTWRTTRQLFARLAARLPRRARSILATLGEGRPA